MIGHDTHTRASVRLGLRGVDCSRRMETESSLLLLVVCFLLVDRPSYSGP